MIPYLLFILLLEIIYFSIPFEFKVKDNKYNLQYFKKGTLYSFIEVYNYKLIKLHKIGGIQLG